MKLFRIENFQAVVNDEEVMLIPEFKAMFELKYNKGKGDHDGRKRVRAFKELTYIYFMADYGSEYANFSPKERHREALEAADLPEKYKISAILKKAMETYEKLQRTLSIKALSAVRNSLLTSMEMADTLEVLMQTELESIRNSLKPVKKEEDETEAQFLLSQAQSRELAVNSMASLLKLIGSSSKIANDIPKTIKTLDNLEEKVKTEQETDAKARGDQEGGWMD